MVSWFNRMIKCFYIRKAEYWASWDVFVFNVRTVLSNSMRCLSLNTYGMCIGSNIFNTKIKMLWIRFYITDYYNKNIFYDNPLDNS